MNPMFWWAVGGLVFAMVLLLAAVIIVQLSARVRYIPTGNVYQGDYTITGETHNGFTFIGGVNVDDAHDHQGAVLALRGWAFRRGALIKTIVHADTATVVYSRK